eukprot:5264694-Prymnesium_polylepis.1
MGDDSAAQSPQHSPHEERGALDVTRTREGFEGLSTKGTEYKEKLNQRRASADDIQMNYERDYLQRRASPGLKWQRSTAIIMLAHEKGEKVGEVTEEDNSAEKPASAKPAHAAIHTIPSRKKSEKKTPWLTSCCPTILNAQCMYAGAKCGKDFVCLFAWCVEDVRGRAMLSCRS